MVIQVFGGLDHSWGDYLAINYGVPTKLLVLFSVDEIYLAVHSHAFRVLIDQNEQSKSVAK